MRTKASIAALLLALVGTGIWVASRLPGEPDGNVARARSDRSMTGRPDPDMEQRASDPAAGGASTSEPGEESIQEVVVFDGELRLRVQSVDVLSRITPFHEEPIVTYYDWLAEAASAGDTDAALELGFVLLRCVGYATNQEALDEKIDRMQQTHLVENPGQQEPRFVDDIQPYVELERQRFGICRGLSEEQVMGSDAWFDLAAELGDYFAQAGAMERALDRFWLSEGFPEDVESFADIAKEVQRFASLQPGRLQETVEYVTKARERGSLQALRDLALLYSADAIRPRNAYSPGANAYANLLAASVVWRQIWGPGSYTYEDDLARMSSMLGEYEIKWAEEHARTLLSDAGCCRNP